MLSIPAAAFLMRTQFSIAKDKCVSLLSGHAPSFGCQQKEIFAECNGKIPRPITLDNGYMNDMQYQENMISKRCELMYDTWRRTALYQETETRLNQLESRNGKFVIGPIGKDGGFLELKNRGIQLYIPPGAMKPAGDVEYVFVYTDTVQCKFVCYDVIICGPPGLQFSNSVLLRFPKSKPKHEELAVQNRPPAVKLSVQELGDPMIWRSLDTSKDGFYFLEDGDVFLHLNHFTGIKADEVLSTPSTEDQLNKTIYVSAFLEQHDCCYLSLRVFCSTYSALKLLIKEESDSDSRRVGIPVKIGSYQSRDEVKIIIAKCVDCRVEPCDYTICVADIISDMGYVFRQFLLEPNGSTDEAYLNFQVNVCDNTVHVAHVKAGSTSKDTKAAVNKSDKEKYNLQEPAFTASPLTHPILSFGLRRELSIELDVLRESQMQGETDMTLCDYRGLAHLMGMSESYINWLGAPKNCTSSTSPTILLLTKWEIICRKRLLTNDGALRELKYFLNILKHNKCINIVDEYTKSASKPKTGQSLHLTVDGRRNSMENAMPRRARNESFLKTIHSDRYRQLADNASSNAHIEQGWIRRQTSYDAVIKEDFFRPRQSSMPARICL